MGGKKRNEKVDPLKAESRKRWLKRKKEMYQRRAESQKVISTEEDVVPAKAESLGSDYYRRRF